jgi:transposase
MRRNQAVLAITDEQRGELSKWAASRTLPAGDGFRARLILALADGETYNQIMTSLRTTAPTISRWKQRFEQEGIDGLDPRHKGSQPRVADAAVQARIARKTQQKRKHALVMPQDGAGARTEQVHRAAGVGADAIEATPARRLHGVE